MSADSHGFRLKIFFEKFNLKLSCTIKNKILNLRFWGKLSPFFFQICSNLFQLERKSEVKTPGVQNMIKMAGEVSCRPKSQEGRNKADRFFLSTNSMNMTGKNEQNNRIISNRYTGNTEEEINLVASQPKIKLLLRRRYQGIIDSSSRRECF